MTTIFDMIDCTSAAFNHKATQILKQLSGAGFNYFCFQFVSNQGQWFTIANDPEWLIHSAENQFYQYDPSLLCPARACSSIKLPKLFENDAFQSTLVGHAESYFDYHHPLAICERASKGCYYMFLGTPKYNHQIVEYYIQYAHYLKTTFFNYVKSQLQEIWQDCMAVSIDLKALSPEQFFNQDKNLFSKEADPLLPMQDFVNLIKVLTEKELECINLYKQGMTAKESARVLNVSPRTLEDRFENIKDKLSLQSKRELLALPL